MCYNLCMKIKELRKSLNLSQTELANKIGVSQRSISDFENGNRSPDARILIKLADFFQVSTDVLIGRNFKSINFSKLSDSHYELISKLSNLTEFECQKVLGYIDSLERK